MIKYIDADKIRVEIERLYDGEAPKHDQQCDFSDGYFTGISVISNFLDSLQQEQPNVQNGKFVFPKYLYARTKDNKTIDVSYAPQSLDAVEYINSDFLQQSDEDLNTDIEMEWDSFNKHLAEYDNESEEVVWLNWNSFNDVASHFSKLGFNVRKGN